MRQERRQGKRRQGPFLCYKGGYPWGVARGGRSMSRVILAEWRSSHRGRNNSSRNSKNSMQFRFDVLSPPSGIR